MGPELILDIVAENPQIEHVAAQVQPSAVHEHGREDCVGIACRIGRTASE